MMTMVRFQSLGYDPEWLKNKTMRDLGFESIVVRDHRDTNKRGMVIVWADHPGVASVMIEKFQYGNQADYGGHERDTLRVHLSALGNACAVAAHVAESGSLFHIPRCFGGLGK
jgi:hypothetical protein